MTPVREGKWLLNPIERSGEILFGLIMTLTFTCSISIANTRIAEVNNNLLAGAIGCNVAWGIVDAVMFLIGVLIQRNRNKMILDFVRKSSRTEEAIKHISDTLPPIVATYIKPETLEKIRSEIANMPDVAKVNLTIKDIRKAISLFFLVAASALPVVAPFIFIDDTAIALRVSNSIAILMMFLCGWSLASYVGINKWLMSSALVIFGVILVVVTIVLGG
jgi:hypothetical protein